MGRRSQKPPTWTGKKFIDLSSSEAERCMSLINEAWKSGLHGVAFLAMTGLEEEDASELADRNPRLKAVRDAGFQMIKGRAKLNVVKQIEDGNVKDSKWLLERTDEDFNPKQNINVGGKHIVVPVEEKEKAIEEMMQKYGNSEK